MSNRFGFLLHEDVPYGWQGFVFVALLLVVLVLLINELAARAMKGKPKKRRRNLRSKSH